MAATESDGLLLLATQLEAAGQWVGAAKCYEAVLHSGGQLPQAEGATRLHLARLLLQHTHNVHEARKYLDGAKMVLRPLKSGLALSLRLEVLDSLATTQRLQQKPRQRRATIREALELCSCEDALKAPHAAAAADWLPRLRLAAAELDAAAGDHDAAKGHVAAAAQAAQQSGQLQAQAAAMLFQMQLLLSEGATDAFEAAHSSTAAALSGAQLPPPLSAELRLHCAALHAVYLLRQGRTVGLGPPGANQALPNPQQAANQRPLPTGAALQQLLTEADTGGRPWQHVWLDPAEATALVALLEASMARPSGLIDEAVAAANRGVNALEPLLQSAGVSIQAGEAALSLHGRAAGRLPLALLCLLQESAAAALLTACRLAEAQPHILAVHTAVRAFPTLLASLRSSASALAGAYATSVGEFEVAGQHFHCAAEAAPDIAARHMATIQAAAAEAGSGDAAAISSAIGRLQAEGLYGKPHESLPNQERAAGQLVAGRLQLGQGQQNGKLLLTRSLKIAHAAMANLQLVSQILNALAPVQRQADASGASNMLTSSYTLARSLADIPSQVESLTALDLILINEDDGVAKVAANRRRAASRRGELQAVVAAAAANAEQHAAVLNWRL